MEAGPSLGTSQNYVSSPKMFAHPCDK